MSAAKTSTVNQKKKELHRQFKRFLASGFVALILCVVMGTVYTYASPAVNVEINSGVGEGATLGTMEILFMLVFIAMLPTILIMMTSFTRVVIVFSFLRNAMGTQNSPPNQIIIGLALFLTLFIMRPVIDEINTTAYQPYTEGIITQEEFFESAQIPLKRFMIMQVQKNDLSLFMTLADEPLPENFEQAGPEALMDLGMEIVTPAFITSEVKRAFTIGFLIYIPFLIIDMIVSSTLMSMGMVMLPPAMISLPFKIMLFVTVDGWGMLISSLVRGFYT